MKAISCHTHPKSVSNITLCPTLPYNRCPSPFPLRRSPEALLSPHMSDLPDLPQRPHLFDPKITVASLPELPGVYRMLGREGEVLYVGKAKNLKARVASYFRANLPSPRIALMVQQIAAIETTVVGSETEALLLENNLIKRHAPRFNILFRDDKSYPYIRITQDDFPRLGFHRGATDRKSRYFGPFPAVSAVRESMALLQKMFRLRTCEDSVFANRSRPCLLYQIGRCSGPCVGLISAQDYAADVHLAVLFLQGRSDVVQERLMASMQDAAAALAFERAAQIRDQIRALQPLSEQQSVDSQDGQNADIIVAVEEGGVLCVNLAMVRAGRHLGDRPLFPGYRGQAGANEALLAFLLQHYSEFPAPERLWLEPALNNEEIQELEDALPGLADRLASHPRRLLPRRWLEMAEQNARLAVRSRKQRQTLQGERIEALRAGLDLAEIPYRIECFDISHTGGEATVASCVVYQGDEMRRGEYRRFNIHHITPGDDYAAMAQAVARRYDGLVSGVKEGGGAESGVRPDLILIDGGLGQVRAAQTALDELGLSDLPLIGVSKGEERKPGLEQLVFADGRTPLQWPPDHPGLHLIQEIRDEAHRFAISGHRARRAKPRSTSRLEDLPGIGPARRKSLITHLGGLPGVREASIDQIARVPGISRALAERIFSLLHS